MNNSFVPIAEVGVEFDNLANYIEWGPIYHQIVPVELVEKHAPLERVLLRDAQSVRYDEFGQ